MHDVVYVPERSGKTLFEDAQAAICLAIVYRWETADMLETLENMTEPLDGREDPVAEFIGGVQEVQENVLEDLLEKARKAIYADLLPAAHIVYNWRSVTFNLEALEQLTKCCECLDSLQALADKRDCGADAYLDLVGSEGVNTLEEFRKSLENAIHIVNNDGQSMFDEMFKKE